MPDRPTLGDVRGPKDNQVRENAAAKEAAPMPPLPAVPVPAAAPPDVDPDAQLTPVERYRKYLKAAEISEKEAVAVIDAMVSKGFYEEYFHLGTKRGTFRTRAYENTVRLQSELEAVRPQFRSSTDEIISRYNLAGSLVEWNGVKFEVDTDEKFEAALSRVKKMHGPLIAFMSNRLARFDLKMNIIFSDEEGASALFVDPVG